MRTGAMGSGWRRLLVVTLAGVLLAAWQPVGAGTSVPDSSRAVADSTHAGTTPQGRGTLSRRGSIGLLPVVVAAAVVYLVGAALVHPPVPQGSAPPHD